MRAKPHSMRPRLSNFLDIVKCLILADLLWTDLTFLIAKQIVLKDWRAWTDMDVICREYANSEKHITIFSYMYRTVMRCESYHSAGIIRL